MSRAHGRITVVWTKDLGTTLTQDEAAGATVLHVDDVAPFNDDEVFDEDENLGYLQVGAQTVGYTAVDDDASTITLAAALAADASQDDDVLVWDDLYGEVDTQQWAWVEPDGGDRQDPYEVEVDDSFELVDGDRGKRGESCTIRRLPGSDVWTLVHVSGRPSKARGLRFEADDSYTLTAADIAAGSATMFLTHRPVDESVTLWWRTVAQEPTEYTVNADAQTITLPLADFAAAGDRVWVHYAYRKGLAREVVVPDVPGLVPLTHVNTAGVHVYTTISNTQSISLGSVLPGDLIAFACIGDGGTIACPDPRMTLALSTTYNGNPLKIWLGKDNGLGSPLDIDVHYDSSSFLCEFSMAAVVVRPDSPVDWTGVVSDQSGPTGSTVPGVSGGSGVVALAVSDGGTSADYGWYWPSPYTAQVGFGTYLYVTSAVQQGSMIADAVLSTAGGHARRAILLGIGLG